MPAKPSASRVPASVSRTAASAARVPTAAKQEPKILFQKYFKSVGPRTYAAQVKEAVNGNHFLVLTEGKRDPETGEVKKTKVFVYSEDFGQYFRMLHETAQFIKGHPVSEDVKLKRQRHWAKKEAEQAAAAREVATRPVRPVPPTKIAPVKAASRRPARGR
jgi:hypothetical protein